MVSVRVGVRVFVEVGVAEAVRLLCCVAVNSAVNVSLGVVLGSGVIVYVWNTSPPTWLETVRVGGCSDCPPLANSVAKKAISI